MEKTIDAEDKIPSIPELRERIENVSRTRVRIPLMFQFLTGARVSEVCGKYAINTNDFQQSEYSGNPIVIFKINTAKRMGRERHIALPLNEEYESWTKDLLKYFLNRFEVIKRRGVFSNNKKVFSFHPRTLQRHGRKVFEGFVYPIESYSTFSDKKNVVSRHTRQLTTHGLRHMRATDLMMNYGFDVIDLTIFMGWTFKTSLGFSPSSMDRYVMTQWSRFITKLFKAPK